MTVVLEVTQKRNKMDQRSLQIMVERKEKDGGYSGVNTHL